MSVDKPVVVEDIKAVNGARSDHLNGVQNGYTSSDKHKSSHKSSSKDKHRDKDRDHKSSSKHSSSSSNRDKDRHSSSKSQSSSSHKSSSSKDKERSDKDRGRSDKDRDRGSDKSKSSDNLRDKDKSDKHKSSSSSSNTDKDRKHSSKDHKSSSSSSKDKDRSDKDRNDKDKERSDKDKHRSDKDKHHSSSSKDKSSSSSNGTSKDKHSSKERSHSSSKDKHSSSSRDRSSSSIKSPDKKEDIKIKTESEEMPPPMLKIEPLILNDSKMDWNSYDDSPDPLAHNTTASSCDYSLSQFKDEPLGDKIDEESEEDIPLASRKNKRKSFASDSEEEKPLSARKIPKIPKKEKKTKKKEPDYEDDDYSEEDIKPAKKKTKLKTKVKKEVKPAAVSTSAASPTKRKKKQEDEPEVWKWWEEEKKDDGTKWKYLEHKGPLFAPEYIRLPKNVIFKYDGKEITLSEDTEEVAGFYAKMIEHDYTTKDVFNTNFFNDWRKVMTDKEKSTIKDLRKCDFKSMHAFFTAQSEKNRNKTKEEKLDLKTKNEEILKEYGFCTIDGHKEKIGNFRIEPPGLFRGRGEHPKMGMHKKRVVPEHVIINCSKDSAMPKAPDGRKWKEVRHDNSVTWLASWTENVQGQVKYVMLNPSSKLKGEKDWQKYETARKLAKCVDKIRNTYREEWKAKEMRIRQRAVALYFIDKLALRAGNEKDEDQADTVGCCSLRVEHIELHKEKDGREHVVVFDFLGKDSIRYYNEVPVEKRVFKNLELFKENKKDGDDLFDRLNTQTMNEHLRELMPNLTAKVFRTFNASFTLQNQLNELTDPDASVEEKMLSYNRANRAVAVLCNHQRAVPKGHQKSMEALKEKIQTKRDQLDDAEVEMKDLIRLSKKGSVKDKLNADKKKKALQRLKEQLRKLEVQETDRDENKTIALGTSKLNYLDPRISIAWCKKNNVPIEKIFNKTQRDKFRWAIDMATIDYVF